MAGIRRLGGSYPYRYADLTAAVKFDINPDLTITIEGETVSDDVESYFGTPLNGQQIETNLIGENYNVQDNFMRIDSRWLRSRLDFNLTDSSKLKNVLYHYTADRHWKNAEVYTYSPQDGTVTSDVLIEIKHDHIITGNKLMFENKHEILGMKNQVVVGLDLSKNNFKHTNNSPYSGSQQLDAKQPGSWLFR